MLYWSNTQYQFTLGLGALAMVGMMSEGWKNVLSVWVALAIALLPLGVFIFIQPGELPARLVRIAHSFASIWYVATAFVLLAAMMFRPIPPQGWLIYPGLAAAGFIPCLLVLWRIAQGQYRSHEEEPSEADF